MDLREGSPAAVAVILGERLKQARLNADMTQTQVSELSGVSRKMVMGAEKGKVQLETLVAIMQALGLSDHLNRFLPEQTISPVQLARLQGKKRQRASGSTSVKPEGGSEW
ncbi:helix-turn-helix transcriptional regulator [Amphritea pacifica]|uniref:helix-turn-helix transcriptional regulator n=1 Tax=Amphritea pacifica TaxID=2811233 RepID=UPI001965BF16|nr:helix-turn-helix transcriptional regulator [Amphritea pacifica]MBN1007131.1 helix-turn-helix transcriptional regulator [Amphritea pacifica]